MVRLTQINGEEIVINAELIETIEQAHDTILTLTTTRKIRVKEGLDEIIEKVVEYRKRISGSSLEDRLKA
ncbi:MAG: flagellar FlbD family protein [Bacteroidetes bacterium]|jgi:flagellar protein FlbD|nr:flagellar FlbD family protein [Bacteroidota bacterium]